MNPALSTPRNGDSVFDRPLHLSGVLDNAADQLNRTWFGYEWNDRTRCNCGIVACEILRSSPARLQKLLPPIYENGVFRPSWRSMTETYCADTGLARHEVFGPLLAAGLRPADFAHLEELSHPEIRARMGPFRRATDAVRHSRKSDVVAYLRAWAVGIEAWREAHYPESVGRVELAST
jgi:hypothetical protein